MTCPSTSLEVANELQGLEITARLREAYDRLTEGFLSLHKVVSQQVPHGVWRDLLHLADNAESSGASQVMPLLKEKQPLLHDYVMKLKGAIFIDTLLQGEITEERLQKKRREIHDRLSGLGASYELVELLQKPYRQRPRGRPAAKTIRYLQALDFKNANPTTSWGKLARKFCDDPSQANTLKAWAYRKKKELAEIGVPIRLDNPDYQQVHPHHASCP